MEYLSSENFADFNFRLLIFVGFNIRQSGNSMAAATNSYS